MVKKPKNPWIAAVLNFVLNGLGYVYVGKRVGFGVGLIFVSLILWWGVAIDDLPPAVWLDAVLLSILFAYDGYKTAEEINSRKSS